MEFNKNIEATIKASTAVKTKINKTFIVKTFVLEIVSVLNKIKNNNIHIISDIKKNL